MRFLKTLAIVAGLSALGCGERVVGEDLDAGADLDGAIDTDSSDSGADSDIDTDGGPPGKWAMLLNATIIQTGIPILNSQWVASRNWYLVDVKPDGHGDFVTKDELCAIRLKIETPLNKSIVPQRFIDHVRVLERHITAGPGLPGSPWQSDVVNEVRGANLCDPQNDPLPPNQSAQDSDSTPCDQACTGSQCDQDEDGHPGMTNILSGVLNCEVYVALRWWSRLDGTILDNTAIAGAVTDYFSEQHVLASTSDVCDQGDPGTLDSQCPQQQYFRMVKVPNNATCDTVLSLTRCAGPGSDEDNCDALGPDDPDALPLDPNNDQPDDCP